MIPPAKSKTLTPTEQTSSQIGEQSVSSAVFEAVSDAAGVAPEEMPVLYDVVDPDALNSLFSDGTTNASVRFEYAGYLVTVDADESIGVRPITDESP